jgi:HK97 family phage major capsid protein
LSEVDPQAARRARVVAHLSEPVPLRLIADHRALQDWLNSELADGVLDELEGQLITCPGTGETFTGIVATAGVTAVAWSVDIITTLRKARTALQVKSEQPTAWVLNPADAEIVDLTKESTGGGFLSAYGGDSEVAAGNNVFGSIPRVVSNSVPAGTGLLADWNQVRLYVRESVRIDVDTGGTLFDTNQAKFRGEGRFGLAVLRPQAFAVVDLTA